MANEQLSAWLDGELGATESEIVVKNLGRHAGQREACSAYWLIGDCLRGEAQRPVDLSARVMQALEFEPVVLAPAPSRSGRLAGQLMPMAAAVAGLAVAAWMSLSLWTSPLQAGGVTLVESSKVPDAEVVSVDHAADSLSDERSYLMAHQASARGAPMVGVAQYIRSVSVEQAGGR